MKDMYEIFDGTEQLNQFLKENRVIIKNVQCHNDKIDDIGIQFEMLPVKSSPVLESARRKTAAERNWDEHVAILLDGLLTADDTTGEYPIEELRCSHLDRVARYCRDIPQEEGEKLMRWFYDSSNYRLRDVKRFLDTMNRYRVN